jgi:hypothetical protein
MYFKQNLNTAVVTTRFVVENNSPILFVFHYDDNTWQFSGVEANLTDEDFRVVSLGEMIEYDQSILELENMPINSEAMRLDEKSSWRITVKN